MPLCLTSVPHNKPTVPDSMCSDRNEDKLLISVARKILRADIDSEPRVHALHGNRRVSHGRHLRRARGWPLCHVVGAALSL